VAHCATHFQEQTGRRRFGSGAGKGIGPGGMAQDSPPHRRPIARKPENPGIARLQKSFTFSCNIRRIEEIKYCIGNILPRRNSMATQESHQNRYLIWAFLGVVVIVSYFLLRMILWMDGA
jgi:hypothetical protein